MASCIKVNSRERESQSHDLCFSANLRIRKVHLGMLRLELLQQLQLLLLVTRRLPHLLLPLVIHHLLHHRPRLAVQVAQLRVVWRNLGRVDLGRRCHHVRPPLHLVRLVEVNRQLLAVFAALERPRRLVDDDGVGKRALHTRTHTQTALVVASKEELEW